jgi:hypothetical protein
VRIEEPKNRANNPNTTANETFNVARQPTPPAEGIILRIVDQKFFDWELLWKCNILTLINLPKKY